MMDPGHGETHPSHPSSAQVHPFGSGIEWKMPYVRAWFLEIGNETL